MMPPEGQPEVDAVDPLTLENYIPYAPLDTYKPYYTNAADPEYLRHVAQIGQWLHTADGRAFVREARGVQREAEVVRRRDDARSGRYVTQKKLSPLLRERMRRCRHTRFRDKDIAVVVSTEGEASWRGIMSCNCRSCIHCGTRLAQRDAELIEALVQVHGYQRTAMATFTIRHWQRCKIERLRKGLVLSFRRMMQHREWREHPALGKVDMVRALEVTLMGEHGPHPHLHVLLLLEAAEVGDAELAALQSFLAELWRDTVDRVMGRAFRPTLEHGVDVTRCRRADYLSKLGFEVTDAAHVKRSHNVTGKSYWQVVEEWDGQDVDDPQALAIREYIEGMHGAKIVTWSRALKKRAEKILDKPKPEERERASLFPEEWDQFRNLCTDEGVDARAAVLTVAEHAPVGQVDAHVRAFVEKLLIARRRPRGPPKRI